MICIPIKKRTVRGVLNSIEEVQKVGDLVEVWFDELNKLTKESAEEIIKKARLPIIYKSSGEKEKIELVLKEKIDYIDLDMETSAKVIKSVKKLNPKTKIILSHHDFKETPSLNVLNQIAAKMLKKGADVVKIATTAQCLLSSLRMLEFIKNQSKKSKVIGICMGKDGEITRTTGHLFGNYLMYAPLKRSEKTAPGQIIAKELKAIRNTI